MASQVKPNGVSVLLMYIGRGAFARAYERVFRGLYSLIFRRLTENQDIFGAAQFERKLMKRELRRRLT